MSASTTTFTASHTTRRTRRSWILTRTTVVVGAIAAAIVTAAAGLLHAVGVSFEIDGEMIPLAGFAQMTLLGAVLGGLIAAASIRDAADPQRWFVRAAVVLTVLSCVPSLMLPPDVATKLTLVATHVIAALIVVPALARQTRP